jgi:GNAT superfamily N-acetyltransferase
MSHVAKVEIRELTPELLDDYLRFFDKDAFTDFPEWSDCYCGFYDTPGTEWDASPKARSVHRAARAERIRSGKAHGLLAIADGRVVGWCNAQPRSSFLNMRRYTTVIDDPAERVGSIMCFVVSPGHRGRGVATVLLNAACDKFRRDELRVAEGYPTTNPVKRDWETPWAQENYKGSLNMYLKAGFTVHRQLERFAIVRKQL